MKKECSHATIHKKSIKGGAWDKEPPEREYFNELSRTSRNQIVWGANHFIERMPKNSSCWIFWDKDRYGDFADGELAWTSFKTAVRKFKWTWDGFRKQQQEDRWHPTQKPIALYKYLLQNYAKIGDRIFDSHGGSFSHAIACHDLGFELTIIEKDKDYFDAAVKRLKDHQTKQKEIRELGYAKTELEKINPILF